MYRVMSVVNVLQDVAAATVMLEKLAWLLCCCGTWGRSTCACGTCAQQPSGWGVSSLPDERIIPVVGVCLLCFPAAKLRCLRRVYMPVHRTAQLDGTR
jgi:hypothetical protein